MKHLRFILRWTIPLFFLATVVMWVRSYFRVDTISWSDSQHFIDLVSSGGRLNVTHTDWEGRTAWRSGWASNTRSRADAPPHWEKLKHNNGRRRFAGFEWSLSLWPMAESNVFVSFHVPLYSLRAAPYWAIALLLALPEFARVRVALRRRVRLRKQLCPNCAYDLRATPDRCPECGETVPSCR